VKLGILVYSVLILKQTIKKEVYTVQSQVVNNDLFLEKEFKITLNKENFEIAYFLSGASQAVMQNI
jgi:hypothetical protein